MEEPAANVTVTHPNRDKAESKATKAAVILLLLTSAALIAIVTIGGWSQLQGAQMVAFAYVIVYLVMAFFVARWNRGVLPVAAALAILFAVVAAVAGPAWFDRDKAGFDDPMLEPSILGLLTVIIVPVQILLIAFAMRGFQQEWNVEVEVARDDAGAALLRPTPAQASPARPPRSRGRPARLQRGCASRRRGGGGGSSGGGRGGGGGREVGTGGGTRPGGGTGIR